MRMTRCSGGFRPPLTKHFYRVHGNCVWLARRSFNEGGSNAGDAVEWVDPAGEGKAFYRVRGAKQ